MEQYNNEDELLQVVMQQYEENKSFRKKAHNAIRQKCIDLITKYISEIAKTLWGGVKQYSVDVVVGKFMEWVPFSVGF